MTDRTRDSSPDLAPRASPVVEQVAALVEGLRRFPTLVELRASRFYRDHRDTLRDLLETPLAGGLAGGAGLAPGSFRVVQWNVEKGTRFEALARALESHPQLAGAGVVMLNEVDLGMARSGNRHVARELAERLGMHWVFAPAHLELTKGVGADLEAEGENEIGLQGNAILSRWPLERPRVVGLPVCFEAFHFHEKRYGRRVAAVADLQTERGTVVLAGTHLEVRDTPRCRARQTRTLVDALPRRGPVLVAGDFNCGTFSRGTVARTVRGTIRLLGDPDRLRGELRDPASREPLFLELRRGGFSLDGWNTSDITIVERIDALEDARHLPGPIRRAVLRRLDRLGRRLEFRLDWFAGRELSPRDPVTVHDVTGTDGLRASDHDPIVVTIELGERQGLR